MDRLETGGCRPEVCNASIEIVHSVGIVVLLGIGTSIVFSADLQGKSPLDELPPYIRQVTILGSGPTGPMMASGRLEKTYGDVYESTSPPGILRPMTHHYFHAGYTRALYLGNGDILLSGARHLRSEHPKPSRSQKTAEPGCSRRT